MAVQSSESRYRVAPAKKSKTAVSILIVEDDPAASALTSRIIAMQYPDAAIYSAADGLTGLELFQRHAPRIVITDIGMPLKSGIELAREIRLLGPGTKLIMLTAYSDELFVQLCKEIGIQAYLLKPLNLEKLLTAIAACLEEIAAES